MSRSSHTGRWWNKLKCHHLWCSEEECGNEPSLVLNVFSRVVDADATSGGGNVCEGCVYQGGFRCVGNLDWLQQHNIVAVVNTAKDLGSFFRKFNGMVDRAKAAGIDFYECGWVDGGSQTLEPAVLLGALQFIDEALAPASSSGRGVAGSSGAGRRGVLIHCAQGKSRSGAVSVAYVSRHKGVDVDTALSIVQEGRRMAHPNHHFMEQLRKYYREGLFDH